MGQQSFGHWFTRPTGDQICFGSVYKCHPWWETITELGTVDLHP